MRLFEYWSRSLTAARRAGPAGHRYLHISALSLKRSPPARGATRLDGQARRPASCIFASVGPDDGMSYLSS